MCFIVLLSLFNMLVWQIVMLSLSPHVRKCKMWLSLSCYTMLFTKPCYPKLFQCMMIVRLPVISVCLYFKFPRCFPRSFFFCFTPQFLGWILSLFTPTFFMFLGKMMLTFQPLIMSLFRSQHRFYRLLFLFRGGFFVAILSVTSFFRFEFLTCFGNQRLINTLLDRFDRYTRLSRFDRFIKFNILRIGSMFRFQFSFTLLSFLFTFFISCLWWYSRTCRWEHTFTWSEIAIWRAVTASRATMPTIRTSKCVFFHATAIPCQR